MKETNYTPSLWYCDMQLLSICINLEIPGSSHLSSRPIPSPQSSWKAFWKTCATLPYHGGAQLFGTFPRSNLCVRMVSFSAWSIVHLVRNISHPSVSIDISRISPSSASCIAISIRRFWASWFDPHRVMCISTVRMVTFEAMFDRPWRGAPAASNESLDLAATAGIQV